MGHLDLQFLELVLVGASGSKAEGRGSNGQASCEADREGDLPQFTATSHFQHRHVICRSNGQVVIVWPRIQWNHDPVQLE